MIEKRRYQRTSAIDGDVTHPHFTCEDISETGLKFRVTEPQTVGSTFKASLTVLDEPVDVTCKIMWCRKSSVLYDETYFIGVEFVDFSVLTQLKLRDIVNARIDIEEQNQNP